MIDQLYDFQFTPDITVISFIPIYQFYIISFINYIIYQNSILHDLSNI